MRNIMLRYMDVLSTIDTNGLARNGSGSVTSTISTYSLRVGTADRRAVARLTTAHIFLKKRKAFGPVCRQARPLPRLYGLSSNPNDKRLARHLSLRIISSTKHRVASYITGVLRHDTQIFTLFGL